MEFNITITFFGVLLLFIIDGSCKYLNKKFYNSILENSTINYTYIVITWLLLIIAIQIFILSRPDIKNLNVLFLGLILGFCLYGTYSFSSAIISSDKWNLKIIGGNIVWGTFLTGIITYCLYKIKVLL